MVNLISVVARKCDGLEIQRDLIDWITHVATQLTYAYYKF